MADLEDMLLEAAGRTGTSGMKKRTRPHSGRTRRVNDNISDDCDDSDSAPSIGSDLYKDDRDKEELGKMSELDRELILAERSMKIDDYRLKKKARESSSKTDYSTKKSPPRQLSVSKLRTKTMRQRCPRDYPKFRNLAAEGTGFLDDLEESSDNDTGNGADGRAEKSNYIADTADDLSDSNPLELEDVREITIRRSKLVKWFVEPFFEDVIVGCFVRVRVAKTRTGPKYRLCLVKSVDASDPDRQYDLEGRTTHKWLNCAWGICEGSASRCQMAVVSESPPSEEEFMEWVAEVERNGDKIPSCRDVDMKKAKIQEISSFVYSARTVKQLLDQKKPTSIRRLNFAAEKDRLRKEIEAAESRGDESAAQGLRMKLEELVELSQKSKQLDEKAVRLAEINRKNKAENFKNASERKPINTGLRAGEEGYDPFSRRWTRSRNYYSSKAQEIVISDGAATSIVSSGEEDGVGAGKGAEVGIERTASTLKASDGAGKLVDTNAPVDVGTALNLLHVFDVPISLAGLESFGGPPGASLAFMARKQKIEATIGCRVAENDEKQHLLTLTVSDYKRRRGLL
ncbi:hypothetical protein KSP39_PZI006891 [Platanthera zijinensis]|uniref:Plus3 domain-containing protein n=1 Tax=Platanthera zijinensis TaxID=2320716 RepID=A0AAP0BSB8_9ASPA